MQPTWAMASSKREAMSSPRMRTVPRSGRASPTSMRIVVVFPAPLGPRNPKTSPARTSKETSETASRRPKRFVRFWAESTTSAGSGIRGAPHAIERIIRFLMAVRFSASRVWLWTAPLFVGGAAAVLFAVGFALALRGSLGEPLGEPPPPPRQAFVPAAAGKGAVRILVLGDSLAKGTGDETGKGFAARVLDGFRAKGPAELTNLGVNGMESPEVLALAETANVRALARSASLILLSAGGNDLSHGATSFGPRGRESARDLAEAVAAARGRYVEGLRKILETLREENPSAPILRPRPLRSLSTGPSGSTQAGDSESGAARLGASVDPPVERARAGDGARRSPASPSCRPSICSRDGPTGCRRTGTTRTATPTRRSPRGCCRW